MKKRLLSILMCLVMLAGILPTASLAAEETKTPSFSDMPDNWSTQAIQNAVENGLLNGSDGKIMPNDNLTRAQMAAVIVRAFGASVEGDISSFSDVNTLDWFAGDMAKAYQMGVIKGAYGKMNPSGAITRQEVFVIIARALKLQPSETINKIFPDTGETADWAKGEVYALVNQGYIQGSDGKLAPKAPITRAQFAQIFDNIIKQYISRSGVVTEVADGNVMINVPGVTLKNLKINGDLIVGDGVGDGEVILENVSVVGRMIVRGGGENSIIIRGSSNVSNVILSRVDGAVSVKVQGDANVEVIYVDDGSDDVVVEGTVGSVEVQASDVVVTAYSAAITSVEISGANSKVIVAVNSTVGTVSIQQDAAHAKLEVSGTVSTVITTAPGTEVTGTGTVKKVEAQTGATDAKIVTPKTEITVQTGVTGVTGGGGSAIQSGSTAINNTAGTDIVTSSGEGSLPLINVTNVRVANSATVAVTMPQLAGATFTWNGSGVTGTYADGKYTLTVPTIKTVANTLMVSAIGYTNTSNHVAIEDGTYGNLTVVSNSDGLKVAIAAQADNQVWILKSGVYDVTGHVDAAIGITERTGSQMIIRSNGITVQGIGAPTITADSDAGFVFSDDGTLTGQQVIYILGNDVSIDGIKVVPTNDENKTICVEGDNIALSNIATQPRSGSTLGGAIYFNNAGRTALLSNAVLNYGRISFSGATGATVTLNNVEVKFAGSSLEGEGPYYAYNNPSLATVTATNLKVNMSAAIGRGLQTAVSMLPSGATAKLDAGTYYVSAALTKPTGVTVDTDTNDATIVIAQIIVDGAYTGTDGEAVGGIKCYSTIQAAVGGATAGDTILVMSGTYTEIGEIEVSKALTIKGQNYWEGDTYHESTFVGVTPATGATHCDTIFWVHNCADVYISGFTLDRDVEIDGTETPTSQTGVVFTGRCDFNGSTVRNCKVIGERVVPDDNCFSALEVIQVDNVIFENNIVEGVVNQDEFAAEEFYDGGIGALGGSEGIVIRGNHINGLGTAASPRGGSGISCVMAGDVIVENNEITGCRYGIYENQVHTAITNNEIYSNDIGVQCGGWTFELHNNSIYDNRVSISCGYSAAEKVDVTRNYWGDTDYAAIADTFDGNVAFFPWAMDEAKDSDGNYANLCPIVVNADWSAHPQNTAPIPTLSEGAATYPTLTPVQADIDGDGTDETYNIGINAFGTLAEAVSAAASGDTIQVVAGTYDEIVTVSNKSITLVGTDRAQCRIKAISAYSGTGNVFTLDNLTVYGNNGSGQSFAGVFISNGTVIMNNCDIVAAESGTDTTKRGIETEYNNSANITVNGCSISGYKSPYFNPSTGTLALTNNDFNGKGPSVDTIENVTISGNANLSIGLFIGYNHLDEDYETVLSGLNAAIKDFAIYVHANNPGAIVKLSSNGAGANSGTWGSFLTEVVDGQLTITGVS